ncbi:MULTISPECIES: abortive infection family protein [unclassified Methylobacterium]|nr:MULTISPECIES: abortive infection family protein [unclassified Methylobacterium]
MSSGYVLDFSDRTMAEWFEEGFGMDIQSGAYDATGSSKAKRLRTFIEVEDGHTVGAVLRALWVYAEETRDQRVIPPSEAEVATVFAFIDRIEAIEERPRTDALERFKRDDTLDELIAAIQRDIAANKPAPALDRLHLYCMKKFTHLLDERRIPWDREEPLHSRVGKYVRALERERELRRITVRVLKTAIGIFDDLNDVRNNRSFAHDNDLVDAAEARFIFDAVSAILRFVKSVDTGRFGS